MVKNPIKVYARLKNDKENKGQYQITKRNDHENIVFNYKRLSDKQHNYKFRFHKIFDKNSSQEDVFDIIAKPVVNSVINGYNGTILAYGQTGSGKTYSITGSSKSYNNRGLIPRSIEKIFEFINNSLDKFSVHISYLEIYNEIGYDLLNPKQPATMLEELPRVVLLEDGKGESHVRNLSVLSASSEQEAMRLLFLGDTNRTIAETPVNEYSSRSHCLFTIYLTSRSAQANRIRKCKLHLVDLAGSERIHKTNISGVTLNEAKHINLSLHYLEQVIKALSQSNRHHIPYRNSMMTFMLRDSLSGNSLTAMLTTLSTSPDNIEETLSTCKFAQRVALINTEAIINEEIDPQQEINLLKGEVVDLQTQLAVLKGLNINEELTSNQKQECKYLVENYLKGSNTLPIAKELKQIQYCFELLRNAFREKRTTHEDTVDKKIVKQNIEIQNNREVIHNSKTMHTGEMVDDIKLLNYSKTTVNCDLDQNIRSIQNKEHQAAMKSKQDESNPNIKRFESSALKNLLPSPHDRLIFERYISNPKNHSEIESYYQMLDKKYEFAEIVATTIEECRQNIIKIRQRMETLGGDYRNFQEVNDLNCQLMFYQNIYRETILQLENLQNEIEHIKHGLKQAEIKAVLKFKERLSSYDKGPCGRDEVTFDDKVFNVLETCYNSYESNIQGGFCLNASMSYPQTYLDSTNSYSSYAFSNVSKRNMSLEPTNYAEHMDAMKPRNCKDPMLRLGPKLSVSRNPMGIPSISSYDGSLFPMQQNISFIKPSNKITNFNVGSDQSEASSGKQNIANDDAIRNSYSSGTAIGQSIQDPSNITNDSSARVDSHSIDRYNGIENILTNIRREDVIEATTVANCQPVKDCAHSEEFLDFMKTVPLTGDQDVDDEIYSFYKSKFT